MNTLYLIFEDYGEDYLPSKLIKTGKKFPEIMHHPITIQLPYLPNVGDVIEINLTDEENEGFYTVEHIYHNFDTELNFIKTEIGLKNIEI